MMPVFNTLNESATNTSGVRKVILSNAFAKPSSLDNCSET